MSLVTRCPRCSTLFRVTPAQLQMREGKVRCGRCMHVFDGFEALAAEQASAASEPIAIEAPDLAGDENTPERAVQSGPDATPGSPAAQNQSVFPGMYTAARTAPARAPEVERRIRPPLSRTSTTTQTWAVGSLVLLLILGLQVAFVYRSELAARYPVMKSAFTELCDVAGCAVPLPQRPHLVKIEASDVHMLDTSRPGLIQLTATVRSYANYDLAYPALDLVLTNANEHALARRIFVPDEYLDATRDPKKGIPPNAEITIALDLDTANLNAAGFRLDLLSAPPP